MDYCDSRHFSFTHVSSHDNAKNKFLTSSLLVAGPSAAVKTWKMVRTSSAIASQMKPSRVGGWERRPSWLNIPATFSCVDANVLPHVASEKSTLASEGSASVSLLRTSVAIPSARSERLLEYPSEMMLFVCGQKIRSVLGTKSTTTSGGLSRGQWATEEHLRFRSLITFSTRLDSWAGFFTLCHTLKLEEHNCVRSWVRSSDVES